MIVLLPVLAFVFVSLLVTAGAMAMSPDRAAAIDRGGCFSVSNLGMFGVTEFSAILNPPQSGILGLHKIEERAVVRGGQIVIRPMMYLALSYDHRLVDGREAVSFLVKVREGIEDPERILLEV